MDLGLGDELENVTMVKRRPRSGDWAAVCPIVQRPAGMRQNTAMAIEGEGSPLAIADDPDQTTLAIEVAPVAGGEGGGTPVAGGEGGAQAQGGGRTPVTAEQRMEWVRAFEAIAGTIADQPAAFAEPRAKAKAKANPKANAKAKAKGKGKGKGQGKQLRQRR